MFLLLLFKTDHFLILSYIKFQDTTSVKKKKKNDWIYNLALIEVDNMFAIAQISDESFLIVQSLSSTSNFILFIFMKVYAKNKEKLKYDY